MSRIGREQRRIKVEPVKLPAPLKQPDQKPIEQPAPVEQPIEAPVPVHHGG